MSDALIQTAFYVNWKFIYTEEAVSRHFLDYYAYFELISPNGHFRSGQYDVFIGYCELNVCYPTHHHASEELYFVLDCKALFESDGDALATFDPAILRSRASSQPHSMTTIDRTILTFVLCRRRQLSGRPQIVKKRYYTHRPNRYYPEYGQLTRRSLFPLWHHRQDRGYANPD